MLKFENIEKSFGEKKVLRGVSLTLEKGDICALSGMSGCGKTTLLRILAGLEKMDGGRFTADGKIAFSFAEARLFPKFTVLENVASVLSEKSKKEREARALLCLEKMGLPDAAMLFPTELSTGMAARVSLARAMAYDGDIYFLDEPFKSLDGEIKRMVMDEFRDFLKEKICFFISHDPLESDYFATKKYCLKDGILQKENSDSKSNIS